MNNTECVYNGNTYSHGSTICSNSSELVCNNGNWEPTGKVCNSDEIDSTIPEQTINQLEENNSQQ